LKKKTVKYYVQAIHYSNFTIRLVDSDVQKDDCFSIPRHSLIIDDYPDNRDYLPYNRGWFFYNNISLDSSTFVFISCPKPILSPPKYIVDASSCKNGSTLFNSHNMEGYSSYVLIDSSLGNIPDLCHVNLMYPASFTFQPKNETNISYIDVHDSIIYGFDLSWSGACCDFLKENHCKLDEANMSIYCSTLLSLSLSLSHTHTHTHTHTHSAPIKREKSCVTDCLELLLALSFISAA
jgi:hypothetical protein